MDTKPSKSRHSNLKPFTCGHTLLGGLSTLTQSWPERPSTLLLCVDYEPEHAPGCKHAAPRQCLIVRSHGDSTGPTGPGDLYPSEEWSSAP